MFIQYTITTKYHINSLQIMAWTPTAISIAITLGRFLIRHLKRKRMGYDDLLNGIAVLFLLAFLGTWQVIGPPLYQQQLFQQGLTSSKPPSINSQTVLKIGLANSLLFWCTIYCVKASFLALYWIIFNVSDRFRIAWWLVTVYTVVAFLVTFVMTFRKCGSTHEFLDERELWIQTRYLEANRIRFMCGGQRFDDIADIGDVVRSRCRRGSFQYV